MFATNIVQSGVVESLRHADPVRQPVTPPDSNGVSPFGPAFVRKNGVTGEVSLEIYGSDARLARTLEQRDMQVRQGEAAKGEAFDDENFIYQEGPDGKRYAVGTRPHLVKRDDQPGPEGAKDGGAKGADGRELSQSDQELLQRLQARDAKVRNHEAAHVMAAGGQASLPTYEYQLGPDGRRYAIGGAVNLSILSTGEAGADARQAGRALRAALATGEPSAKDIQAAGKARDLMTKAMQKAAEQYAAVRDRR